MSKLRYTGGSPGWMSGHETWSPGDEREIADGAELKRLLAGPFEAVSDHIAGAGTKVGVDADHFADAGKPIDLEAQSKPTRTRKPQEA